MDDWFYNETVKVRELLHSIPELGGNENETSAFIAGYLKKLGLEVSNPFGTALVATLHGGRPGRRVALRADMDALPIRERTGCGFSSVNESVMHACGHDVHMASAIGAAMLLSRKRDDLSGEVLFVFEPDEEGDGGAAALVESGSLDGVSCVFGGHVCPDLPLGTVGVRFGKFYAASDMFTITITGKSCHGATPEKGIDALRVACEVVGELRSLHTESGDRSVLSIGVFNAGTVCNVIAGEATLKGILRTLGQDDRREMKEKLRATVERVSARYGAGHRIELRESYGGVVNTERETSLLKLSAEQVVGRANVIELTEPTMATEDFGVYVDAFGGSFCHIGVGGDEPLHSASFLPDSLSAVIAAQVFAQCIENALNS